ncbi:hypothetical protein C0992_004696 [Termitomyces sp. T32_za158]|nr:hypothetical protein C0992_004696 [Termitomyces sp. T32_za158]
MANGFLEKRYTCVHTTCLPSSDSTPTYYPTWTTLQHHIRTAHPPTCTYASCNGRVFASQKGLRAHQKLHEQRELEEEMEAASDDEDAVSLQPPRKKRRGGEIGRDWKCDVDDCQKDFKSKKALNTHTQITHLGRRDYVCPQAGCGQTYGYKHLLQRHLAKAHHTSDEDTPHEDDPDETGWVSGDKIPRQATSTSLDIDTITGHSYAQRTRAKIANATALLCPYPQLGNITPLTENVQNEPGSQTHVTGTCEYAFSRAYDLRRHLKAAHGVDAIKESVDEWVSEQKRARRLAVDSSLAPSV